MIDFWTYRWLVPQRSETKKEDRTAGYNLGDFNSQAGGRTVLGNSVGKKREEVIGRSMAIKNLGSFHPPWSSDCSLVDLL